MTPAHLEAHTPRPIVLKLGSSVLADLAGIRVAARRITERVSRGHRFICVVSAVGDTTDALLRDARALNGTAPAISLAALLATGEDAAAALLSIALDGEGVKSRIARAGTFRLLTAGSRLDARPIGLNRSWLLRSIEAVPVVIVPGFVGVCGKGRPSVLGRGGSDLSALFIAHELGLDECHLVKDVPGLFTWDPNDTTRPPPDRLQVASWSDAVRLGRQLVQPKAVQFAEQRNQRFRIVDLRGYGTTVGPGPRVVATTAEHEHERSRCA